MLTQYIGSRPIGLYFSISQLHLEVSPSTREGGFVVFFFILDLWLCFFIS